MAPPMSAADFLDALRDEGVTVVEVGDWRHHNRNHKGPWGPVHGVMIHHTVTQGSEHTVELCRDGYEDLPGPLCHGVITKDGRVHLVGYGRANHAGLGDDDVLRAVIAEKPLPPDNEANTDGNRHFYGFECENLGDGHDPGRTSSWRRSSGWPPRSAATTAGRNGRSSATGSGNPARWIPAGSPWRRCGSASETASSDTRQGPPPVTMGA